MAAEKNFENRLKRRLQSIGIYDFGTPVDKMPVSPIGYYEKRWGGGYSKKGLPDMHIVVNGISVEVELKGEKGTPDILQIRNLKQIDQSGSYAILLYPKDYILFQNFILCVVEDDENASYNYELLKSERKRFENIMLKGE